MFYRVYDLIEIVFVHNYKRFCLYYSPYEKKIYKSLSENPAFQDIFAFVYCIMNEYTKLKEEDSELDPQLINQACFNAISNARAEQYQFHRSYLYKPAFGNPSIYGVSKAREYTDIEEEFAWYLNNDNIKQINIANYISTIVPKQKYTYKYKFSLRDPSRPQWRKLVRVLRRPKWRRLFH